MAPKITPKVLLETSRFLKTIKNFRGPYEALAARVAAGRAGVVNVGGRDAGEFFDTFLKALGLPLSVLSAGCARPAAGAPVTVVAYGSDVPLKSYVSEAVDKLAFKKLERSFYSFEFAAGDLGSYESGLPQYGSIEHLFIFAHGEAEPVPTVRSLPPGTGEATPRGVRGQTAGQPELMSYVAGIPVGVLVNTVTPYVRPPCVVRITACELDVPALDQYDRPGVDFGASPKFATHGYWISFGCEDMFEQIDFEIDGERIRLNYVGPPVRQRRKPSPEYVPQGAR